MSPFLAGPTYLLISLPIDTWSVVVGVVISLLSGVIIFFFKSLLRIIAIVVGRGPRYSLAGIWIGTCVLPNYPQGVVAIEIYRLVVRGDHVSFKFFNYRPDIRAILKYLGAGISRGQLLSAYYYMPLAQRSESGVFAMRKTGEILLGVYAQYDLRADEKLKVSRENFALMRVEIPLWNHLRMRVNKPPFGKYEEVEKLYNNALAAYALQPAAESPEIAGK
jgi:hypothetical protein